MEQEDPAQEIPAQPLYINGATANATNDETSQKKSSNFWKKRKHG